QQAFVGLGGYALFGAIVIAGCDPLLAVLLAGVAAAVVAAVLGPLVLAARPRCIAAVVAVAIVEELGLSAPISRVVATS
ncbi:hypothetical protein KC218_28690, partial [Mycobacterium tuberculosis]|nr:hypothetical protein [Mycobacterium tuberculosis]